MFDSRLGRFAFLFIPLSACADPPPASAAGSSGAESNEGTGFGSTDGILDATAGDATADDEGSSESTGGADDSAGDDGGSPAPDGLPWDPDQLDRVCDRGNQDPIALRLCSIAPDDVEGLTSLYTELEATIIAAQVTLLANSSAVSTRSVSVINPRVIVTLPLDGGEVGEIQIGAIAFSRGEQMVEMMGHDPVADRLNFYVLPFFQACNDTDAGCTTADRYTDAVESDWEAWTLYQDVDLENTPFDCLTCHQPAGPGSPRLLLNRQASDPWMHWFPGFSFGTGAPTQSSDALTPLFSQMHANETAYAGIPMAMILPPAQMASGIVMQQLLDSYWFAQGGPPAPLNERGQQHDFDSIAIEAEFAAGSTETWDSYYDEVLSGNRLPIPHYRHDITDPEMRAAAVESFQAVISGAAEPQSLLDPAHVLSAQTEAELSFRPRPGASAEEILHHICQRCHNDELDQTLSRANFNAERPAELTALQRQNALARISLQDGQPGQMPPPRFATIDEDSLATLVDFLSQ